MEIDWCFIVAIVLWSTLWFGIGYMNGKAEEE